MTFCFIDFLSLLYEKLRNLAKICLKTNFCLYFCLNKKHHFYTLVYFQLSIEVCYGPKGHPVKVGALAHFSPLLNLQGEPGLLNKIFENHNFCTWSLFYIMIDASSLNFNIFGPIEKKLWTFQNFQKIPHKGHPNFEPSLDPLGVTHESAYGT